MRDNFDTNWVSNYLSLDKEVNNLGTCNVTFLGKSHLSPKIRILDNVNFGSIEISSDNYP